MISFENDYLVGTHPRILERLAQTNMEQLPGYTEDRYCLSAREKIRAACEAPEAAVAFLAGGTQTNALACSALLREWGSVVCAQTGHVATHEAGAIEYTGHKVLPLPQHWGKLDAGELAAFLEAFFADQVSEHMAIPGMVYISHPTEYGTLYSLAELTELARVCRRYALPLYLDGARLAYGLMSRETDVTLPDIARLCDAFYIGGAKCGALFGEALVFPRSAPDHFLNRMKRHGALTAKGRVLGVQFDALFTDGLYFDLGRRGIDTAEELKEILRAAGVPLYLETPTNQQFLILSKDRYRRLSQRVTLCPWEMPDPDHIAVRAATSWATTEQDLAQLRDALTTASPA